MAPSLSARKSTDEGLDQDFNSLDAQREACETYISSQKHEGWTALSALYDDGGISGATTARPALRQLLSDIEAGLIDVVVVYKVDRLTRSLADFAKIVEIFDAKGVSFVSVTQQFNTTTSMGRLTLNVLLSFAQFERELTGERIRDKIAASKKKGMWMGGNVPLGYDAKDRTLTINEAEAETVHTLFRLYLELGSVRAPQPEAHRRGLRSKTSNAFSYGHIYFLLQNPIYIGRIRHKKAGYPGLHPPIIDLDLWERVQVRLSENRVERRSGAASRDPSLLAGMLHDDSGERMTPSHAVKRRDAEGSRPDRETNNGKCCRYYVSRSLTMRSRETAPKGRRLPAGEIERLVADRFRMFLSTRAEVHHAIEAFIPEAREQSWIVDRAIELSELWSDLSPAERRGILLVLGTRVEVHPERVDIKLTPQRIPGLLRNQPFDLSPVPETTRHDDRLTLSVPARLRRVGLEIKMLIDGLGPGGGKTVPDPSLIRPLVKAHSPRDKIVHGGGQPLAELAEREGINASYFTRLIRLTFLAPDITKAILEGRQPPDLTAAKLLRDTRLPLDWEEQRTALGFI